MHQRHVPLEYGAWRSSSEFIRLCFFGSLEVQSRVLHLLHATVIASRGEDIQWLCCDSLLGQALAPARRRSFATARKLIVAIPGLVICQLGLDRTEHSLWIPKTQPGPLGRREAEHFGRSEISIDKLKDLWRTPELALRL